MGCLNGAQPPFHRITREDSCCAKGKQPPSVLPKRDVLKVLRLGATLLVKIN